MGRIGGESRTDVLRLTTAGLWVLLAVVVVLNSWGSFNTDVKPEIYFAPWQTLQHSFAAWTSSPYLGSPNFNVGLLPVLFVTVPLHALGLAPEWVFKLSHLALWTLAAVGASRFTRAIAPELGRWGALVAAVAYLANPYTISAGATLAIALPLALLPWLLLALWRALHVNSGWVWPAWFALTFFAMSGMNAGIVPLLQLLAVIPVVVAARWTHAVSWRHIAGVLVRCAVLVVAVSLYWMVPTVFAQGTGARIVTASETIAGISRVSSLTEVLRGLGSWPLYGSSDQGAWVPQHAVYVAVPWIIAVTALWPLTALASTLWTRNGVRRWFALSVAIAAVVMVGVFPGPGTSTSLFGALLGELFENPVIAAFRTTNKIGAVLTLAFAIGVAASVMRLLPWLWRWPGLQPILVVTMSMVFIGWTFPAVGGRLYISAMDVPRYWESAADALNRESDLGSVLVLPGQVRPHYRWSVERPDDVLNSVLTRTAVVPDTTPNASAPGVNFLAALDQSVQAGAASPTVISSMARYLGASDVLLRNDLVWETAGGARPAAASALLSADPGLRGVANYGKPGENVMGDASGYQYGEQFLPPLQWFRVTGSPTRLRTRPVIGSVVVAGDGYSFAALDEAGRLRGTPMVRYAQDVSGKAWTTQLPRTSRMVLTDTNMRRDRISNRLTANEGALLRADEPLGSTVTLGTNPDDQTVKLESGVTVTTSKAGGTFFNLPYAAGEFAIDGNPATAWRFGDFGSAVGARITVHFAEPVVLDDVPISQLGIGNRRIAQVKVTAGGVAQYIDLSKGTGTARFGGLRTSELTVDVTRLSGTGYNLVGISEIGIPSVPRVLAARTPLTFTNRYAASDTAQRQLFDRTPLDVLLTRVVNTASTSDDSETELSRVVNLPDARTFDAKARVRVAGPLDPIYDDLQGRSTDVRAESSGFYFNVPSVRASAAADDNPRTAWQPGNGTRGAWWQITSAPRRIGAVTIDQQLGKAGRGARTHRATQVSISVDDKPVVSANVRIGTTRITLPRPVTGAKVRVTITGTSGDLSTAPPRFTTIDTGVNVGAPDTARALQVCLRVATVDGGPLLMRPATSRLADVNSTGTVWKSCSRLKWAAGDHSLDPADGFILDSVDLTDNQQPHASGLRAPASQVTLDGSVHKTLRVARASGPFAVVIGQSVDRRWVAYANGRSLGRPLTLDGFSTGWILPAGGARTVDIYYQPQRWTNLAMVASLLALVFVLVTLVLARRRHQPVVAAPTSAYRPVPGLVWEIALICASGFFVGGGGLLAALTIVLVRRTSGAMAPRGWILSGLGLVALAFATYLFAAGHALSGVSANAVTLTLVPHELAGAGLVMALTGALLRRAEDE